MKCEKCNNEYHSYYYFATETICKECFNKMLPEEQQQHALLMYDNMEYDQYALRIGFGMRLGAGIIDWLITTIIFVILLIVTGVYEEFAPYFEDMLTKQNILIEFTEAIIPLMLIISIMYYALEIILAATPGKMILGIQIASDDQKQATSHQLTLRYIFKHLNTLLTLIALYTSLTILDTISSIIAVVIFAGYFFILSPKRQAFHDMLAKTTVFRKENIKINDENIIAE